ncbi:MAG TPA: uracil phosphoribosyltransferase [Deltaproteobacteria bacterium]|nr:uracil phosphoribosyltransferase [Deltaproteobacteria bacterium]HCP46161.1 uracil phosphoribosyltransferase [Deltaproteobacteria bacterium]|tara:strand:- start:825 stop:1634 length:810 start_codon:yes stop_codon:yes gene_type:complete
MRDSAYRQVPFALSEIDHAYGDRTHVLADPLGLSLLARLGHPETHQPDINRLLDRCYTILFAAMVNDLFPRKQVEAATRMCEAIPGASYQGEAIDPATKVVFIGLARAGTLPAYQGFALLNDLCDASGLRVDHVYMQRRTDEQGRVVGVDQTGSKIGGDVDGAVVVLPDPMGATGSSMSDAIDVVKNIEGTPKAIVGLHLIITPEFVARVCGDHPDAHIYALRLDRGLSSEDVLAARPGERDGEVGVNEIHYIVPGAGGLGEVINNSFV